MKDRYYEVWDHETVKYLGWFEDCFEAHRARSNGRVMSESDLKRLRANIHEALADSGVEEASK
jgi:hypothetical protein